MRRAVSLLLVCLVAPIGAQTTIDLGRQGRNIDFSKATATRPVRTVTSLPPVCRVGELVFFEGRADVIYACTATNIWTAQSGALPASGRGIVAQTDSGAVARTLVSGTGLVLANADGQLGNPSIAADLASGDEARAGLVATKVVTPDTVRQAFTAWNPLPLQVGKANAFLTTNGSTPMWSWQLITPSSGTQVLSNASAVITADRTFVRVAPASSFTLSSTPVIADGADGQFLTIANVSATNTLTFADESLAAGSNLRLGGQNLALGPMQSVTFVYVTATSAWMIIQGGSAGAVSGGDVSGPLSSTDGQLSVFSGATGKALKTITATGVLKAVSGVPAAVTGNASDCVKVDGSSSLCSTGDVVGASSSTAGQIAVYAGTTGKTLATANVTGVLKAVSGVPAAVTGNASDCVKVDGSSSLCGTGDVVGASSSTTGQIAVYAGTTGKTLATANVTGVLKAVSGVPAAVTGNASDCVKVDGSSSLCGTGDVTGASSSTAGQIAVYAGTTGKTLAVANITGLVKVTNGVPSAVIGNASDCVKVDGSSGPCASNVGAGVTGPASAVDSQLAIFNGTTGSAIKAANLTGVLKVSSGVPSVVTGTATHLVQVNGGSVAQLSRSVFAWAGSAQTSSNTPQFLAVTGSGSFTTSESTRQLVIPVAGTLSRLYFNKSGYQPASGDLVCLVRVNGATPADTLSITIPGGGVSGVEVYSDLTRTVNVSAGDKIGLMCTNGATAGTNGAMLMSITVLYTFDGSAL